MIDSIKLQGDLNFFDWSIMNTLMKLHFSFNSWHNYV